MLAVGSRGHAVQAKGLSCAGLVDDQRGDAAFGQPGGQPHAVLDLLGGIDTVQLHQHRRRALHAFGANEQRGQWLPVVGNLDPPAALSGQRRAQRKEIEKTPIKRRAPRRPRRLQALAGAVVDGRPVVLGAGGKQPAMHFIFLGERAQALAHLAPRVGENLRVLRLRGSGLRPKPRAHCTDLFRRRAHFDGQVHRVRPHRFVWEMLDHVSIDEPQLDRARADCASCKTPTPRATRCRDTDPWRFNAHTTTPKPSPRFRRTVAPPKLFPWSKCRKAFQIHLSRT